MLENGFSVYGALLDEVASVGPPLVIKPLNSIMPGGHYVHKWHQARVRAREALGMAEEFTKAGYVERPEVIVRRYCPRE